MRWRRGGELKRAEKGISFFGANMRVLIVEDDTFYAQRISELLEDRGADVVRVDSAEDALRVDPATFDAAVIDVMLPNNPEASGISVEESRGGFATGIGVARRILKKKPEVRVVFLSADVAGRESEDGATDNEIPFVGKDEGGDALIAALNRAGVLGEPRKPRTFIAHGHDESALLALKDYIQNTLKWPEPIVLREQPSAGRTIIEKFEDFAQPIECVFVLLTPDDKTVVDGTNDEKRRSRQNVIFEMGFLYGALGRRSGRILLLHKGQVELPSDISGIVWIDISKGIAAAGEEIRRELNAIIESVSKNT